MAYGNWGAFVYKNGERQNNREDNTPYLEDELQAGYWQAFGRGEDKKIDVHHASLGNGPFRLCAYKSAPYLFWEGNLISDLPYRKGDPNQDWYESEGIEGELNGYKFKAIRLTDPEAVELFLFEPDGTVWTGKSGYAMGAGWE